MDTIERNSSEINLAIEPICNDNDSASSDGYLSDGTSQFSDVTIIIEDEMSEEEQIDSIESVGQADLVDDTILDNAHQSGYINDTNNEMQTQSDDDINVGSVKGKSIAHKYMHRDLVYFSFDIEHGGDDCGILQIACQVFRIDGSKNDKNSNSWVVEVEDRVFNEYVKPPTNAKWDDRLNSIHGLHNLHPKIVNANSIEVVWTNFVSYINSHLGTNQKGMLLY